MSQRQVRWLIVLLALLPLIPSGLLLQMMTQNAMRDSEVADSEINSIYRDQLIRVAEKYSSDQANVDGFELAGHLERVFGPEVSISVIPPKEGSSGEGADLSESAIVHEISEGNYAEWTLVLDGVEGFQGYFEEQRRETVWHAVAIVLGVTLVGGIVWYTVHRRLRVDELRSDLLTTISHEIKTPIAASRVLIETLEDGVANEETVGEYLALMAKENDRMTELADQFLTYSRLENGQVNLQRKRCSLPRILEEQVKLIEPQFDAAGGQLTFSCEYEGEVETDPQAVKLVLGNLIENALKYGGNPPNCLVEVKPMDRQIEISVSDTGGGIAKADRRAIFRRFYQGDAELKCGKSGVGLGLSICRHFVRLMEGEIYVAEPRVGEGARLVFTVPHA